MGGSIRIVANPPIMQFTSRPNRISLILAGDIGGTNARFGYYADGKRQALADLLTANFESADALLAAALEALDGENIEACCLALAGPVFGDEAKLTNGDLTFSRQGVAACLQDGKACSQMDVERVHLVNDIVALGSSVALSGNNHEQLFGTLGAATSSESTKGVVAVGTGLGMAVIVDGRCLPSEGGHAGVAPVGGFERELLAATEAELPENTGVISWERYLSGPGLKTLYRAVCHVWGAKPAPLDSQEISSRALAETDPTCHTTLETWVAMLATACGGLAVTALALGGIYLAGPLPLAAAEWLRGPGFRRRFEEAAWAADLQRTPVYLIDDAYAGLDGAHSIAAARLQAMDGGTAC